MSDTRDLYHDATRLIPGGTQLLSKRPELFLPEQWPAYYRRAKGVEVEDLDGRTFVDVSIHAVGACPLGYADPDVDRAVIGAVQAGSMSSLNCLEEVALAERLCGLHPWADNVRFTRGGGEAMAVAVRIARAATGRERVAFCGYHGWHDWYLAANLQDSAALDGHLLPNVDPAGVPRSLAGSAVPFEYGDAAALDAVIDDATDGLAAIVMEPARYALPEPGYLAHVRDAASRAGAALIFDEITSGFRMNVGGLHQKLGVAPDVAVFAKAMSNGYPMGAIIGRRDVMQAATRAFISSTYWTERIGPTAALATLDKLAEHEVPGHLIAAGRRMRSGWVDRAAAHGLRITVRGIDPLPSFAFDYGAQSRAVATLYTQCMLDEGYLAFGGFYASYAHSQAHIGAALDATDRSFGLVRRALDQGRVLETLRGPVAHTGLRKDKR